MRKDCDCPYFCKLLPAVYRWLVTSCNDSAVPERVLLPPCWGCAWLLKVPYIRWVCNLRMLGLQYLQN